VAQEFATEVAQDSPPPAAAPPAPLPPQEAGEFASPEQPAVRVGSQEVRAGAGEEGELHSGLDRPIHVFGGDPLSRSVFSSFTGELRTRFRWAIYRYRPDDRELARQAVHVPIRVKLWGTPTDIYGGADSRLGVELGPDGRLRIDLLLRLHDRFDEERFRLELIRALVLEQVLVPVTRQPEVLGSDPIVVPEWIVHGFDELLEHRRVGRPSSFYAGMVRSGRILSPVELFATEEPEKLTAVDRGLFRATAAAMVGALLAQPGGDAAMRGFLGELSVASQRDPAALMRQYFPAFREVDQGMERWWALQVASLSQQQTFEFLGHEETEQAFKEALILRFEAREDDEGGDGAGARSRGLRGLIGRAAGTVGGGGGGGAVPAFVGDLSEHAAFLDRPDAETTLARCFDNLQHLRVVGHPLYRPVLERYESVVVRLIRGQARGIDEELAEIAALRETVLNTLRRSDDYLNYFEATQAPRRSESFEDYLRLKRDLEASEAPVRWDRISEYLDFLEKEFR